jgi:predicted transcriptional regulator
MHMARTTITLDDTLLADLKTLAKRDNRTTPNLIETILKRYLAEIQFADEFEMANFQEDTALQKDIRKGVADYKKGHYEIVE